MVPVIIAAILLILDQATKFIANHFVELNTGVKTLIPGVLQMVNCRNEGSALAFITGNKIVLAAVLVLLTAVVVVLVARVLKSDLACSGLLILLVGVLGNGVDRLLFGYVTDMFELPKLLPNLAFNLSDILLGAGAILFAVGMFIGVGDDEDEDDEDDEDEEEEDEEEDERPRRGLFARRRNDDEDDEDEDEDDEEDEEEDERPRRGLFARRRNDDEDEEEDEEEEEEPVRKAPPRKVSTAAASVQRPAPPVQKPAAPVQRPAAPAQKPAAPVQKPAAPVQRPAAPVQKPAAPVQKPAAPVQRPAAPVQRPAAPVRRPAAPVQKPVAPAPVEPDFSADEFDLDSILNEFK